MDDTDCSFQWRRQDEVGKVKCCTQFDVDGKIFWENCPGLLAKQGKPLRPSKHETFSLHMKFYITLFDIQFGILLSNPTSAAQVTQQWDKIFNQSSVFSWALWSNKQSGRIMGYWRKRSWRISLSDGRKTLQVPYNTYSWINCSCIHQIINVLFKQKPTMYLTDTWDQLRSYYGRDGRRVNLPTITIVMKKMARI
jgi:hypothetical protein